MRYAFQDDENCFFVLDLMLGGDLRCKWLYYPNRLMHNLSRTSLVHMERQGGIAEDVVRFWVAEIASALEYLHRQRIIHRDLKPDNILLDAMGHAHITDFNVAIHYSERRMHTSLAGSMAYMAPEVIGRKGYTWCVDWWSLGVTAYELLFKKRPFEGRSGERMKYSILKDPLKFPDDAATRCSPEAIQVLQSVSQPLIIQCNRFLITYLICSYWNEVQVNGLDADLMGKVSRISGGIRGSRLLTGQLWNQRNHNLLLCLMYALSMTVMTN